MGEQKKKETSAVNRRKIIAWAVNAVMELCAMSGEHTYLFLKYFLNSHTLNCMKIVFHVFESTALLSFVKFHSCSSARKKKSSLRAHIVIQLADRHMYVRIICSSCLQSTIKRHTAVYYDYLPSQTNHSTERTKKTIM